YKAKEIFEQSPDWVKKKVGSIPVVTLVGIFSAAVEIILLYGSITNSYIGGAPVSYPLSAGIAAIGLVAYYVAKAYRKRQGIDLSMVFSVIPPE
ncbi:MAG: hypothetical protein ACLPY5_00225, partial [Candidatus Bathyarchaeia archaeon]